MNLPRRPPVRRQVPRWRTEANTALLDLQVTADKPGEDPDGLQAQLRVTHLGGWGRTELLIPWPERSGCARVWQRDAGHWLEVAVEGERREGGRCALILSDASGLLSELIAGHPLSLSWGRRAGRFQAQVSGAAQFPAAFAAAAASKPTPAGPAAPRLTKAR